MYEDNLMRNLASLKLNHSLGPLFVHDTMAAFSATDGFARLDDVFCTTVCAEILHVLTRRRQERRDVDSTDSRWLLWMAHNDVALSQLPPARRRPIRLDCQSAHHRLLLATGIPTEQDNRVTVLNGRTT